MPSLKEMRNRIGSVKATQKITKAMQMVAAAKLRRAQDAAQNARPYAARMAAVIANLAASVSGPGAPPLDRLIAYGRARTGFLITHREIARAALDGRQRVPAGSQTPMSREHIRLLLGEMNLGAADLDILATQLTAALDGPLLLYLSSAVLTQAGPQVSERLGRGWQDLIQRVCRSR